MRKQLSKMPFNASKAKEKGFEWFELVIDDYVKRNLLIKPTKTEIKAKFEELTGAKAEVKTVASDESPKGKVSHSKTDK